MSFSVHPVALSDTISNSLVPIRQGLFGGPKPLFLNHYTSPSVVESIIENRCLWATSVAEQADKTEISHAASIVNDAAQQIASRCGCPFAWDVLQQLPHFMEERKSWIFIACFCDDSNSEPHWNNYGDCCLTFPTPWRSGASLGISSWQSECWYQRVVYDGTLQRRALEQALDSVVVAISEHTSGENKGSWANAMVSSCARNIAQLLLALAAGFKHESYAWEREWRIVCSPPLGTNSSAPAWLDENFETRIKRRAYSKAHIELQFRNGLAISQPLLRPPIPFLNWALNPARYVSEKARRINHALDEAGRHDLTLRIRAEAATSS